MSMEIFIIMSSEYMHKAVEIQFYDILQCVKVEAINSKSCSKRNSYPKLATL